MSGFSDKFELINTFLRTLSWKKIAQVSVLLMVLLLAWATYENRESIYSFASREKLARPQTSSYQLSKPTVKTINEYVNKSDIIVAIQVYSFDFQKNSRQVVYAESDLSELKALYSRYAETNIIDQAAFNADQQNNKRMIDLINGDFVCIPYADSLESRAILESSKYIHTVCSFGIPPFYGRFSGTVNAYIKRQMLPDEIDQVRSVVKTLSAMIYDRDLK